MSSNPLSVCSIQRVWVIGMLILFISMYELFVRVRAEYLPISSRGERVAMPPISGLADGGSGYVWWGERIVELDIV